MKRAPRGQIPIDGISTFLYMLLARPRSISNELLCPRNWLCELVRKSFFFFLQFVQNTQYTLLAAIFNNRKRPKTFLVNLRKN